MGIFPKLPFLRIWYSVIGNCVWSRKNCKVILCSIGFLYALRLRDSTIAWRDYFGLSCLLMLLLGTANSQRFDGARNHSHYFIPVIFLVFFVTILKTNFSRKF